MIEILPLVLGILITQISPGPNLMVVASNSLGSGRKTGLAAAAGVASGVFIWAILFTFGVAALFVAFPQSISAFKLLGGAYFLYLAVKALRSAWMQSDEGINPRAVEVSKITAYKTGLLVVLTNPKAALMWVAISAFLASSGLSNLGFLIIGACASVSAMIVYGTYAALFSTGFIMQNYSRFTKYVETSFGVVFGVVGSKLLIDGYRELRP